MQQTYFASTVTVLRPFVSKRAARAWLKANGGGGVFRRCECGCGAPAGKVLEEVKGVKET